jgi:hypothetical protein
MILLPITPIFHKLTSKWKGKKGGKCFEYDEILRGISRDIYGMGF